MITLFDDWVILVDDFNYSLARPVGMRKRRDGKGEEINYRRYGYFNGVSGCLRQLHEEIIRRELKDGRHTLAEALQVVSECTARVENLLSVLEQRERAVS